MGYLIKTFNIIKELCNAYNNEKNKEFFNNLFNDSTKSKIIELKNHKPVDQTAQWDPLELPSDEEYYNLKPGFSFKKLMIKLFGAR